VILPSVYSKNRDRLLEGQIAGALFSEVLAQAKNADLLSDDHFSVDGTLIEAWASQKSFQRKDGSGAPPSDNDRGNPTVNFHGDKRSNDTHESTTDPDARLARKSGSHEAKLAYCGNVLIENRNGLVVDAELLICSGTAERDAARMMIGSLEGAEPVTVGADKGYDTKDFVKDLREMNATPHVAQNNKRPGGSAIDGRTTRHGGYRISQMKRKRIEEVFGWLKTVGLLRKTRHRGTVPRWMGVHLRGHCLQPGEDAQPTVPGSLRWVRLGRTVSGGRKCGLSDTTQRVYKGLIRSEIQLTLVELIELTSGRKETLARARFSSPC
jgi:hypothetical protein